MSAKKAVADLYTSLASRPALQSLHAAVLKFTLYAMGIGYSEHSDRNGERRWLCELHRRLAELSRRAVIFDVGANVGDYAHEVSEVFGARAEIHCFEPSHATFEELSKRTASIDGIVLNQLGKVCILEVLHLKYKGCIMVFQRSIQDPGHFLHIPY